MKEVFARTPDMPKVKVILNDSDQPVGSTSRELASVIGCLARKISVQHSDWRLVDFETFKVPLWKEIKVLSTKKLQLVCTLYFSGCYLVQNNAVFKL
jgi:hypothetical protein